MKEKFLMNKSIYGVLYTKMHSSMWKMHFFQTCAFQGIITKGASVQATFRLKYLVVKGLKKYAQSHCPREQRNKLDACCVYPGRQSLYWEALAILQLSLMSCIWGRTKFNQINVLKLFCLWLHFLESNCSLLVCRSLYQPMNVSVYFP